MKINTNITALNATNKLQLNMVGMEKSVEKLASGLRINRAADDVSGLAISEKLRAQVRGLNMASKNAQDGMTMLNIAEAALGETHSILHRIRELGVQAANDTLVTNDRAVIQDEVNALVEEIDRIATQTQFNTLELNSGNPFSGKFHIGANDLQTMDIELNSMETDQLDVDALEFLSNAEAEAAIDLVDKAMENVAFERGRIGFMTSRLEHVVNVNVINSENTQAAESRIRDVELTKEFLNLTKYNILIESTRSVLAQANQFPGMVIQLLR
jgi:flagellin